LKVFSKMIILIFQFVSITSLVRVQSNAKRMRRSLEPTMSLSQSSPSLSLDGTTLSVGSKIDLNNHIGNIEGVLTWNQSNFGLSSNAMSLNGSTLSARCRRSNGTWNNSTINLDEHISNNNGTLRYTEEKIKANPVPALPVPGVIDQPKKNSTKKKSIIYYTVGGRLLDFKVNGKFIDVPELPENGNWGSIKTLQLELNPCDVLDFHGLDSAFLITIIYYDKNNKATEYNSSTSGWVCDGKVPISYGVNGVKPWDQYGTLPNISASAMWIWSFYFFGDSKCHCLFTIPCDQL